jgi:hypothetical protein
LKDPVEPIHRLRSLNALDPFTHLRSFVHSPWLTALIPAPALALAPALAPAPAPALRSLPPPHPRPHPPPPPNTFPRLAARLHGCAAVPAAPRRTRHCTLPRTLPRPTAHSRTSPSRSCPPSPSALTTCCRTTTQASRRQALVPVLVRTGVVVTGADVWCGHSLACVRRCAFLCGLAGARPRGPSTAHQPLGLAAAGTDSR